MDIDDYLREGESIAILISLYGFDEFLKSEGEFLHQDIKSLFLYLISELLHDER